MTKLNIDQAAEKAVDCMNKKRATKGNAELQNRKILEKVDICKILGTANQGTPLNDSEKYAVIHIGLELGCLQLDELDDDLAETIKS